MNTVKKACIRCCAVMIAAFLILSVSSCAKRTRAIDIINNESSLDVGEKLTLQVAITPEDAENQDVSFVTSDESVARIDGNTLTAVSEGSVTITVIQNKKEFDTIALKITPVIPEEIIFQNDNINLGIGRSLSITAELQPQNTTDKTLIYSSSDSTVARVDGGKLTAVSTGTAVITARHKTGLTAECVVTVTPVLPESMEIQCQPIVYINATQTPSVIFTPADVTDRSVIWSSSDKSVLSVADGVAQGIKAGTAIVTVTHASGVTAEYTVTVKPVLPDKLLIQGASVINVNETAPLSVLFTPVNVTDKYVVWKSSNNSVLSVSDGVMTGIKAGTVTVTATHTAGASAEHTVTVKDVLPEKMEIQGNSSLYVDETVRLSVSFFPKNVTDTNVTWHSSNESVVQVRKGLVEGLKAGTATVTATHASGIKAEMIVTVKAVPAEDVIIFGDLHEVFVDYTMKLTAQVYPTNTTDKSVTWSSDNPSVASVKNGVVRGISPGYTNIRATTSNGKNDMYAITVKASSIKMRVSIRTSDIGVNSAGGEWWGSFRINGISVSDGDWIKINLDDSLKITTEISENAYYFISDSDTSYHTVTSSDLLYGFTINQSVSVIVKDGLLLHAVIWYITYRFSPY